MYIDSNIFIFAALNTDQIGEDCRAIIEKISEGTLPAASSYLSIDEVMWIVKKNTNRMEAVNIAKSMLSLPIRWINVDEPIIMGMLATFQTLKLDPRDALHAASMQEHGLDQILSEDTDFENIGKIKRLSIYDVIN